MHSHPFFSSLACMLFHALPPLVTLSCISFFPQTVCSSVFGSLLLCWHPCVFLPFPQIVCCSVMSALHCTLSVSHGPFFSGCMIWFLLYDLLMHIFFSLSAGMLPCVSSWGYILTLLYNWFFFSESILFSASICLWYSDHWLLCFSLFQVVCGIMLSAFAYILTYSYASPSQLVSCFMLLVISFVLTHSCICPFLQLVGVFVLPVITCMLMPPCASFSPQKVCWF